MFKFQKYQSISLALINLILTNNFRNNFIFLRELNDLSRYGRDVLNFVMLLNGSFKKVFHGRGWTLLWLRELLELWTIMQWVLHMLDLVHIEAWNKRICMVILGGTWTDILIHLISICLLKMPLCWILPGIVCICGLGGGPRLEGGGGPWYGLFCGNCGGIFWGGLPHFFPNWSGAGGRCGPFCGTPFRLNLGYSAVAKLRHVESKIIRMIWKKNHD